MTNQFTLIKAGAKAFPFACALIIFVASSVSAHDDLDLCRLLPERRSPKRSPACRAGLFNATLNNKANLIYLTGYDWSTSTGHLIVMDGETHKIIKQISSPTLNTTLFVDEETNTVWGFDSTVNAPNATVTQYAGRSLKVLKTIPLTIGINEMALTERPANIMRPLTARSKSTIKISNTCPASRAMTIPTSWRSTRRPTRSTCPTIGTQR